MPTRKRRNRTWGEGTVYEFRPGRWLAQAQIDQRRLSAVGRSADEARRRLATKVEDQRVEAVEAVEDITVGDYLNDWVRRIRGTLKPSTWRRYESAIRVHIVPRLGLLHLNQLERRDLTDLYEVLRSGGLGEPQSETSLHHIHATLRVALEAALSEELVLRNVAKGYRAPKMVHRDKVILTPRQAGQLLSAAEGHPLEALFVLAVTTGMREGELLGLRWGHIDLEGRTLTVVGSAGIGYGGEVEIASTKTASGGRTFMLPNAAVRALRDHAAKTRPCGGTDVVFRSPTTGRIMTGTNLLRDHFHPLLKRARLPQMPFHDLRHSAATLYLRAGTPAHVVSRMLGHSSVAITLKLYGHVTDEMRADAADAMDALLTIGPGIPAGPEGYGDVGFILRENPAPYAAH